MAAQSRTVLDEHISPVALVLLVGLGTHVAGWLVALRLNEPLVAAWHAPEAPRFGAPPPPPPQHDEHRGAAGGPSGRNGAAAVAAAAAASASACAATTPPEGNGGAARAQGGGGGGGGGGAKRAGSTHAPTVHGWLVAREWRARASASVAAYVQVLREGGAKVVGLDEAQAQLVLAGGADLHQLFYETFAASDLAGEATHNGGGAARRRHRGGTAGAETRF